MSKAFDLPIRGTRSEYFATVEAAQAYAKELRAYIGKRSQYVVSLWVDIDGSAEVRCSNW